MSSQTIITITCLTAATLLTAGCGKKESTATAPAAPATSAAAPAETTGPRVLELSANDTMKFDVTRLEATAGETVRLVIRNTGNLPKAAMGHNVVVLKAGVSVEEFVAAAAIAGPTKDYFPADRADQTLAHTRVVGPKEKAEVTFTVPTVPGEYVYVCTFPGHLATGMRGVLVVK